MRASLLIASLSLFAAVSASAQVSDMLGKPLPDPSLDVGTVTVRVVDGSPRNPLSGVVVELLSGAEEGARVAKPARTNEQGRASFSGLQVGSTFAVRAAIPAKTAGAEDKALSSDPFPIPTKGGVRFMLSPKPLSLPQRPGPGARGMGGRPNPRNMTGIPRPDPQDPKGTLVIRTVQGELSSTETNAPADTDVYLLAYSINAPVKILKQAVREDGRVEFTRLKTDSSVVYYAMALFKRGGKVDRLISQPITMPPEVGVRLMLAGPDVNSTEPPADDLARFEQQTAPAAGEVRVRVQGDTSGIRELELLEVGNPEVVMRSRLLAPAPSAESVVHRYVSPSSGPAVAPGTISFVARRPNRQPLSNLPVSLYIAGQTQELVTQAQTNEAGTVEFTGLDPKNKYQVRVNLFGRDTNSPLIELTASAGKAQVLEADWREPKGFREAVFKGVPPTGDHVYVARANIRGQMFRSTPFQMMPDRGAGLGMFLYTKPLFAFRGQMDVDDDKLWFHLRIDLANVNKEPMRVPPEGLLIPLPQGFIAGEINQEMGNSARVSLDPGTGVRWRGPIPAGQKFFVVTFALPTEDGAATVDLPLPLGALQSQLAVTRVPGMQLSLPDGAVARERDMPNGKKMTFVENITIDPGQRLVFGVSGLPQRPAWEWNAKLIIGLVVVAMLLWGIFGLFSHRDVTKASEDAAYEERQAKREKLFEELLSLERGPAGKKAEKKKVALRKELESLYQAERYVDSAEGGEKAS